MCSFISRIKVYAYAYNHSPKRKMVPAAYKPRAELFEFALRNTGLSAEWVVHIGDSLNSDIKGAASVGINAIWINRSGREIPDGVNAVGNLLEVYDTEFFQ